MARVRLNETQDLPEDHRWLFERMEKRGGILNIFRALSHSPIALHRFMKLGSYFLEAEGKLDPKLRELAILRAATCVTPCSSRSISWGGARVSDSQIRGIAAPNHALFAEGDGGCRTPVKDLRRARIDATYAAVAEFLNAEEIVELTLVTAATTWCRALNAPGRHRPPAARARRHRYEFVTVKPHRAG